jgi:hypothetical protein
MREGKSLNDIAQANKADPAKIIEAVQATITTQLDVLTRQGRIDQAAIAEFKAELPDMLKAKMAQKNLLTLQGALGRGRGGN